MRFHKPKRQAEDRRDNDLGEFAELFIGGRCFLCRDNRATEVAHICGRVNVPELRHCRCNAFASCHRCHDEILPVMGVKAVFAIKKIRDPDGWDRDKQNALIRARGLGNG